MCINSIFNFKTSLWFQSLNEDELLAKAIAMSLEQEKGTKKGDQPLEDQGVGGALVPIPEEVLTEFSEDLLEFLLSVVPHVRDTVYRSCDLLVALIKRNGDMWMDRAISAVIEKVAKSTRDFGYHWDLYACFYYRNVQTTCTCM